MLRFTKFNPQFGKKKIKFLYKITNRFKKKIYGKEIFFDDRCINFYDNEMQNKTFLLDHLKCDEFVNDITLNNPLTFNQYYEEDEDEDVLIDAEEEEEEEEDTMIDEEEEEEEEEDW